MVSASELEPFSNMRNCYKLTFETVARASYFNYRVGATDVDLVCTSRGLAF